MPLPPISKPMTEGDVETQVVLPLLTRAEFLGHDPASVMSKEFLTAFDIGKGAKARKGYKTGPVFHICPPKFIDVVKRRLELSLAELATYAPETIRYKTPSGVTIS